MGTVDSRNIINKLFAERESDVALVRIFTYILFIVGWLILLKLLTGRLGILPVLGSILHQHPFLERILYALITSLPVFLAVTSLAWLSYYPEIGIGLIASSFVFVLLIFGATAHNLWKYRYYQTPVLDHFVHHY